MRIQLVTPAPLKLNNGNKITALRWIEIFKRLGHRVRLTRRYDGTPCDLLIALPARRSAESTPRLSPRPAQPPPIGLPPRHRLYRDIHRDAEAKESLEYATRL